MTKNTTSSTSRQDLRDRIDTSALPVECSKCGHINTNPHLSLNAAGIRADCQVCGVFIKFLKQKSEYAGSGFVQKIESWLPRLTDRDLVRLQDTIARARDEKGGRHGS